MGAVKEPVAPVQLGDQVKVADDVAARDLRDLGNGAEVFLRHRQPVPAEEALRRVQKKLRLPVHAEIRPSEAEVVDGADHVVVLPRGGVGAGVEILLHPAVELQPPPPALRQIPDTGAVGRLPVPGDAAVRVVGGPAVVGEAQAGHALGRGRLRHGLRGVRPVGEAAVDVEVLRNHVIFSCFTLWSMTWREASSRSTSAGVMPAWAISTRTW